MKRLIVSFLFIYTCLTAQGINPLIWSPVEEDNRFIQQVWGQVCNGTGILNSDADHCNTQWGQHQLEIDIDNDGDNDFIAKVYEDWHTGFQGLGVFKNVYNEDSNNVFVLDSIYKQCGSHGGISAGYFNDDEFIDIYFSTGGYHGPEWMLPDLDCLEQDFFYIGDGSGNFTQDTLLGSLPQGDEFIIGFIQDVFDVNNDALDEILALGWSESMRQIFILSYNDGIQNFGVINKISPLPDESEGEILEWKYADIDGDNWKDMIVTTRMYTDEFWINDIYAYWGDENGLNFDSPVLLASIPALYGALSMVGDEESLTPMDYDSNGDSELLIWYALFEESEYATLPIDSIPQAILRLYDLQGDTLIDITDDAFFEGENKDFNEPGEGVFIKDLNNDGVDDILYSKTWCLEKVNISGLDPDPPGSMGDNECSTFALNLDGKFHLYEVEPTGAGHEEMTLQQFSIELDNYENDLVIYLSFYCTSSLVLNDCSAGNDLSDPDWFPEDWPAQIWHYSIPNVSLVEHNSLPNKFVLHQNYPNPFNPITTLRYDLPENSYVNVTVYDMLGRQVKTLINQTQDAGYKSVIWDATNDYGKPVSAGIYLYQIQAGEYISTKKMVLLK